MSDLPSPETDPEFWDRPSEPPPWRGYPPDMWEDQYVRIFKAGNLLYRGDTARVGKTGTIYEYADKYGWKRKDEE